MFYVTRYWYKYGREGDPVETTSKEYETIEKALAYAERYATGLRFVSVEIYNDDYDVIYEYFANGSFGINRINEYLTKEENINNFEKEKKQKEKAKAIKELIGILDEEYGVKEEQETIEEARAKAKKETEKEKVEELVGFSNTKDDIEKDKIKTNRIRFFISYAELASEFNDFFITCDNILVTTEDICFFLNGCCISYLPIKSYDLVFDFVNHTRTCNSHHYHLVRK